MRAQSIARDTLLTMFVQLQPLIVSSLSITKFHRQEQWPHRTRLLVVECATFVCTGNYFRKERFFNASVNNIR